ncbi:MAG: DUF1080 domain-containing protein [Cyclobacteriaceae bacterium]|nr:DUF1080 domain-containing protein [Cyclobacteriaceae bacterium]
MKNFYFLLVLIPLLSCNSNEKTSDLENNWEPLWNGKDLTGWHSYLATPYNLKTDSVGNAIEPFGIDNDPLEVFKIVDDNDGKAIRISGVAWGMIYTEKDYHNYHLKLKVKWGNDMHPPREKGPRDSGLLYHGFGVPGATSFWMDSQELQIQNGDFGDYWPTGDVEIDVPSVPYKGNYFIYKEGADLRTYYFAEILNTAAEDSLAKRRVYKSTDAEKPLGEWNDVELIVFGDSSIHIVNGEIVMRLYNSRTMKDKTPLTSGKIVLQSEGAEVFYKDLFLKSIPEIPAEYK